MNYNEFISHFDVKKYNNKSCQAICPAHNDKKPSLCIREKDNKILVNCLAGCHTEDVVSKVGLKMSDLFNEPLKKQKNSVKQLEKEYLYTDEEGRVLYKAIRYKPKEFRQAQYINGIWQFNMQNVKYVPYNLPNVVKADIIYFVEGEKDADNLNRLGLTATTTISRSSWIQ